MRYFTNNKYQNVSCRCSSGHQHDSRLESSYCDQLRMLKETGEIRDYSIEPKYDLTVNGKHITNHYPDFLVTNNEGEYEIHETKGVATETWRIKKLLFEAIFPEIPYHVIKDGRRKTYVQQKTSKRITSKDLKRFKK